MKILFEEIKIGIDELPGTLLPGKNIRLSIARLDKIHPVISGNKLFKLHYFLKEAIGSKEKAILTFGGAYSNHLAATAYACKIMNIDSIGIVRAEKPAVLSHTLLQCEGNGMKLHFISRDEYNEKDSANFISSLKNKFGNCSIIPEGGYHPLGADGASLIMDKLSSSDTTHICTAVGTATTLAGLLKNNINNNTIIGIPVLKNMTDIPERISYLCNGKHVNEPVLFDEYHFGGYAKKTKELLDFMNEFYRQFNIPTDFVYTGKMMYGIMDKIKAGYFPEGSNITCLHTGGLQGNDSLPASTLIF